MNLFASLKQSFSAWSNDNVPMLAAALSYYTVFAIGPLLLVIISILGFFIEQSVVEDEVISQLSGLIGQDAAGTIQMIIEGTRDTSAGVISLIIGTVLLLLGASGVFGQLKLALNQIWNIKPRSGRGIFSVVRERILSFAMVVVIAFLLGVSLVATSVVSVLASYFSQVLPAPVWVLEGINAFISFWVILILFALIYRVLPDVKPEWKLIWGGATVAAVLFTVGKTIIGLYIGNSGVASTYGAASSLVVLLLWVYYSSLILLYGAEYVKVSSARKGIAVPVEDHAVGMKTIIEEAPESELSIFEQYIAQMAGRLVSTIVIKVEKKVFGKKKGFWERVQERLDED